MNHSEIADKEIINRYLMHQLDPQELEAFTEHLLFCEECRKELYSREKLVESLNRIAVEQPQSTGTKSTKKKWNDFKVYRIAAIFAFLLIGGYFIFRHFSITPQERYNSPQAEQQHINDTDVQKEVDKLANNIKQQMDKSSPDANDRPARIRGLSELKKTFKANPELEHIMQYQLRGEKATVSMQRPAQDAILHSETAKVDLILQGSISSQNDIKHTIELLLFSNHAADYAKNQPVFKTRLFPDSNATPTSRFDFQISKPLVIPSGRYYIVLENKQDPDPLFVRRIFVDHSSAEE